MGRPLVLEDWYSTLSEAMCNAGLLGQKVGKGFYAYSDPSNPRRAVGESAEAVAVVAAHRAARGITPRDVTDDEVYER